ncbi:hypothetical protein [Pelobium manganitolerans]|uniref:hypothetical protein n=1 Tax=Pelobium manganitolerans TaxID=1842495 RepID=UPI003FA3887A
MKIAIVEICELNHYSAVKALALTYACDSKNQVTVYTLPSFGVFKSLQNEDRISIIEKKASQSTASFLKQINQFGYDVLHINTLSKYHQQFSAINWKSLVLTIHNSEVWFDNAPNKQFQLLKYRLKHNVGGLKQRLYLPIKYFLKGLSKHNHRQQMLAHINKNQQKVLVYSQSQKHFLSAYLPASQIVVFPFSVRENYKDLSKDNSKLRVCIPGSVDNHRRDYDGLFAMLKNKHAQFAGKLCIDLLGYIPANSQALLAKIKELELLGIDFVYNTTFIDEDSFDRRLYSADIILGNLKASLNTQSKYGQTKETGVVFNMIKAGKPGIFPRTYELDPDIAPFCLTYGDNLNDVLINFIKNPAELEALKTQAEFVTRAYQPVNLYPKLVKQLTS